jgi:hypothetical protein
VTQGFTENSTLKTNTGFALKLLGGTAFICWSAATIMAHINALELEIERLKHAVERNTYFSENWPRGTIGSLPDDSEQFMRITFLEKQVGKHEELLDKLRYSGDE